MASDSAKGNDTAWPNQQNDLCAQRWRGSAWASTQSGQRLSCQPGEGVGLQLPINRTTMTDQTGRMPRLSWVFAEHTHDFVGFVMLWLKCKNLQGGPQWYITALLSHHEEDKKKTKKQQQHKTTKLDGQQSDKLSHL